MTKVEEIIIEELLVGKNKFVFVLLDENGKQIYRVVGPEYSKWLAVNIFSESGYEVLAAYDLEEDIGTQWETFRGRYK